MAVEQGPMSGFRDMLAEQMIPRQEMLDTIREVYESYGFVPLKTPALERLSTMQGKYGDEGDQLMYKFEDNGGRAVALRYDHTVPLARVVAQRGRSLALPYKRYSVGEVWRGESPQAGRYREFTQFDADTVGTKSPVADAEIVVMMSDAMLALGADSLIRVNNRRILDGLIEKAGIEDEATARKVISTIDKVEKIGKEQVLREISEFSSDGTATLVSDYLSLAGTAKERLEKLASLLGGSEATEEGVDNLMRVFAMIEGAGYDSDKVVFDQTIARGLNYYTGIVYETTMKGASELGSVCSGGRYDNLIEALGGPKDMPAVGTSIGVDRLFDGLSKLNLVKETKTTTEVLVTNFESKSAPDYMRVAAALRNAGLAAEVYYDAAKIGKQIGFADKMGIPFVVLVGPDELAKNTALVKKLEDGEQVEVRLEELPTAIKSIKDQQQD